MLKKLILVDLNQKYLKTYEVNEERIVKQVVENVMKNLKTRKMKIQ